MSVCVRETGSEQNKEVSPLRGIVRIESMIEEMGSYSGTRDVAATSSGSCGRVYEARGRWMNVELVVKEVCVCVVASCSAQVQSWS